MKIINLLHPVMFASLPVFLLFSHNLGEIPASQLILPTAVLGLSSFIIVVFAGYIQKNYSLAALLSSPLIIFSLTYGIIYDFIGAYLRGTKWHLIVLLSLSILIAIGLATYFYQLFKRRSTHKFTGLNKVFSVIAILMLTFNFMNIGIYYLDDHSHQSINGGPYYSIKNSAGKPDPDIYYIILDEYAGLEQIREAYNYDNGAFAQRLTEKGFYIATKSKTKYASTNLSLAESLNMGIPEKFDDSVGTALDMKISESIGWENKEDLKFKKMIRHNKVLQILKRRGYKYIHFGSWWHSTRYNRQADKNVNYFGFLLKNELNMLLIEKSIIRILFMDKNLWRDGFTYAFNELAKVADMESPKFVFAHMLIPHMPFVFDENGGKVPFGASNDWNDKSLYLGQYKYTTKKIEKVVDDILQKSTRPPIIIIQSDHGVRRDEKNKYKIFNAYYLPYGGNQIVYDEIMPGEIFRKIFEYYFGLKG